MNIKNTHRLEKAVDILMFLSLLITIYACWVNNFLLAQVISELFIGLAIVASSFDFNKKMITAVIRRKKRKKKKRKKRK